MPESRFPNILFFMTDEHRPDIAGFAGNEVVRTPNLNMLAETGVVFTNAYTPSPICVPMRQCMASGQLPRTCGCEFYGDDLPIGYLTFARHFSRHAYSTTACGKLHNMGPDTMGGWNRRVGMDHQLAMTPKHIKGADLIAFENIKKSGDGKWSDAKEIQRAGVGKGPHTEIWDRYATDGMLHVIDEYFLDPYYDKVENHIPHFLYLGLNNPHYPYFADEELFKY